MRKPGGGRQPDVVGEVFEDVRQTQLDGVLRIAVGRPAEPFARDDLTLVSRGSGEDAQQTEEAGDLFGTIAADNVEDGLRGLPGGRSVEDDPSGRCT
ncbi:hypothetical protein [Kribbella ginsengisoli]|uniref:Uncharacterized protein n=1 Tax=Kribbella ginsengisoli TaxID=363865 RepID=A0ABP6Z1F3_9ACTN